MELEPLSEVPKERAAELVQDACTTTSTQLPPKKRAAHQPPRGVMAGFVFMILLGAAFAGGYRWWLHYAAWETTDNAFVAGHVHTVSARIAGTVTEVLAEDNNRVAAGDVLARLDRSDLLLKRRQAEAQRGQADAEAQRGNSEVARAKARLVEAEAQMQKAKLDLDRADQLFRQEKGAISKQEFDHAQAAFDTQQAALKGAQAGVAAADAQHAAAKALQSVADAALADVDLQLGYAEIKAPISGRIGRKNLEVGQRVQPAQALLALVADEVWVVANFKETQLARMRVGQHVQVRLDAFGRRLFSGVIESFSPASGSQFALLPPDNATGNFTRIVQRVPVKITLLRETLRGLEGRIVPGMSAITEVHVGE